MTGLFRLKYLGKVHDYSNQYIETSFFLFLIPVKSYFINLNAKENIEIPLNKTSLKNYYISFALVTSGILLYISLLMFGPKYHEKDSNAYLGYIPAIISGLLLIAGIIYNFKIGKTSHLEKKQRTIFQSVVNVNALPDWLSIDIAKSIYNKHKTNLPAGWKSNVRNEQFSTDEFFYYYTMLSYEQRIAPTPENAELLNILNRRLNK